MRPSIEHAVKPRTPWNFEVQGASQISRDIAKPSPWVAHEYRLIIDLTFDYIPMGNSHALCRKKSTARATFLGLEHFTAFCAAKARVHLYAADGKKASQMKESNK